MTAVLVIDMLNDYFRDGPLREQQSRLVQHINTLIRRARRLGFPIIWVRQEFAPDLSDAFLIMRRENIHITIQGTEGCQLLDELDRNPHDYEIVKKRYSAFFKTSLEDLLRRLAVEQVILAGINTHACIRMAAIDAYQRDLDVIIVRECVASPDAEHHDVTLRYLDAEIAHVRDLKDAFADHEALRDRLVR